MLQKFSRLGSLLMLFMKVIGIQKHNFQRIYQFQLLMLSGQITRALIFIIEPMINTIDLSLIWTPPARNLVTQRETLILHLIATLIFYRCCLPTTTFTISTHNYGSPTTDRRLRFPCSSSERAHVQGVSKLGLDQ
jgi:hypothetical protein